jgi:exodeoxyribonuclease VII large subunit
MGVVVYPVQVQGAAAPMSVSRALRRCNDEGLAQVIIVARAILGSRLPVVTALGHTSDRTVADMVADFEARTPTEAGSRVVPKKSDLIALLRERERRLDRETNQRLQREAEKLHVKRARLIQVLPAMVRTRADRLAHAAANLARLSPVQQVARREESLRERARRLASAGVARLMRAGNALGSRRAQDRLERALTERFASEQRRLDHLRQQLIAFSPEAVLARGYSITVDAETGHVVRSAAETAVNRKVRIRLATGRLGARVEQVER